ncbi:hypothetical protein MAR_027728 [Mya arenaria]|uniref:Uncharacterized protein n=1 Tax=Mya arenaria TaxID=6604 RepID=A0ABY7EUC1_MYAAR|nr:hypothetical protein MAR_027728 [Mya arenaria]
MQYDNLLSRSSILKSVSEVFVRSESAMVADLLAMFFMCAAHSCQLAEKEWAANSCSANKCQLTAEVIQHVRGTYNMIGELEKGKQDTDLQQRLAIKRQYELELKNDKLKKEIKRFRQTPACQRPTHPYSSHRMTPIRTQQSCRTSSCRTSSITNATATMPAIDDCYLCRKLWKVVGNHGKSKAHLKSCETSNNCVAIMQGEKKDIESILLSQLLSQTVVEALNELATDYNDRKAARYRQSVLNFRFIISLVGIEHMFSILVGLSKRLQPETIDLLAAVKETRVVVALLLFGRQQNRTNVPRDTPSQLWKTNVYLPFLEHLLADLDVRLLQVNSGYNAQYFIPTQVH